MNKRLGFAFETVYGGLKVPRSVMYIGGPLNGVTEEIDSRLRKIHVPLRREDSHLFIADSKEHMTAMRLSKGLVYLVYHVTDKLTACGGHYMAFPDDKPNAE
jgi:hypothetical protein